MSNAVEDKRFELLNATLDLDESAGDDQWPDFDAWQRVREAVRELHKAETGETTEGRKVETLDDARLFYLGDQEGVTAGLEEPLDDWPSDEEEGYTNREWLIDQYGSFKDDELATPLKAAFRLGLQQCADFIQDEISADMCEEELAEAFLQIQPPQE